MTMQTIYPLFTALPLAAAFFTLLVTKIKKNAADYIALKQNFGLGSGATRSQGDLNKDGAVDYDDLQIVMTNFGAGAGTTPATAPDPSTLGLLALGALAVLKRKRQS